MDFGNALSLLKGGRVVARQEWNGVWIKLQEPDGGSEDIYISTTQGDLAPWLPTQADILADDWCEI